MGEISILTEEEAGAVWQAENDVFPDAYSFAMVKTTILAPYSLCLGILEDNTLVGYVLGTLILSEAEILRIAVVPSKRGQGFGERLLTHFLSEAERKGAERVFLEVRADNTPAVSLYRKAGFCALSTRKNYYQNPTCDAVNMSCTLGDTKNENIGF